MLVKRKVKVVAERNFLLCRRTLTFSWKQFIVSDWLRSVKPSRKDWYVSIFGEKFVHRLPSIDLIHCVSKKGPPTLSIVIFKRMNRF